MELKLWPHQIAAINATRTAIDARRSAGLVSMPTGTGKTVAFVTLASELEWPTLVLVHRDELVRQSVETFGEVWPDASVGVVQAERDEWQHHDAVVASVQSLHERRLHKIPRERFGLVVADEAHHAVAPSWAAVLDHFDARFTLGVTATPERADGKGLAERFGERPLYVYPLRQAIEDDRLARLVQYCIETTATLDGVAYRAGDFATGELSSAVNTPERNRVVVEAYQKHSPERRALAFTVDVQHADDLCDAFNEAGITAAVVTGGTPLDDRRQILADFAAGEITVVCNCAVLTEGFDDPGIGAVLMARPTCSRGLYTQCIGRGLRKADGKVDCLVLDFVDNSRRHKLVTLLSLLGAPHARNAAGQDVLQVVDVDRAEAERRREIGKQRPLRWRLERVCPWLAAPDLTGYVPTERWHRDHATGKQIEYLMRFGLGGVDDRIPCGLTKGAASYLIDRALELEAKYPTPATPNQRYFLARAGQWRDGMSKREARRAIGELCAQRRREIRQQNQCVV